jgi:orotidine-5'-phosphate decarboxylase
MHQQKRGILKVNTKELEPRNRLIFALDVSDMGRARELISGLKDHVGVFKVGFQLFTREGPAILEELHQQGAKCFLDLKFHDIPTTVAQAAQWAAESGVYMFNVHASGGRDMMRAAVDAVHRVHSSQPPIMLAVTILTSMDDNALRKIGFSFQSKEAVFNLARLSKESSMDGVVASPEEIMGIKFGIKGDFIVVTPGVRPLEAQKNDHKRAATPLKAIEAGADFIVVGRPIRDAVDPAKAADEICFEIEKALKD